MTVCGARRWVLDAERVCQRERDHEPPHRDGDVTWREIVPEIRLREE